ncbi:MAG: hypothetical protein CES88_10395 [Halobacteriovorax sp. JY17]|nr:MAG: hypothetical protein CES88_10395 [Halobacteriovorax sp. JY17]
MTKEQLDIYVGYFLILLFPMLELVLFNIIKKTWSNFKLRSRNYLFIFCMVVGVASWVVIVISQLYKVGYLA